MLSNGPTRNVCIYVNEDMHHNLAPLCGAILSILIHRGVAGATAASS